MSGSAGQVNWMMILLTLVAVPVAIVAVIYLIVPLFKGLAWLVRQVARFIFGEIGDLFRIIGAILTALVFMPLVIVNVLIGRWSAASHYGRAFLSEFQSIGGCLYRMAIGHPARLLCLTNITEGIEQRLPQAVAQAPTADRPHGKKGQFEGYTIVGSLPGGGSGGKLYIATPDAIKRAGFERSGQAGVSQVVIKVFSLDDGSSLPQIVRESRALEAAKKLGLVLDHELNDQRFFYVMRYVPGDSLSLVTQRMHALSGPDGLSRTQLGMAMGYAADLLGTLRTYHEGGLWHKDVKPDNIIVDGSSAHLVDFGLVTPLRSGMTLTTHGTEYFRDPEMVKMALKGVKVHEVDGARFDVYAAGAVLYSMIENSFPAHGGLSQIGKQCPEALRWIVRRAMTDYQKRYPTATAMLADLEMVRRAVDPFALRPVDLPSMRSAAEDLGVATPAAFEPAIPPPLPDPAPRPAAPRTPADELAAGAAMIGAASVRLAQDAMRAAGLQNPAAGASPTGPRRRPSLRVTNWWAGSYQAEPDAMDAGAVAAPRAASPVVPLEGRRPAHEQLASARARAQQAQARVRTRLATRRKTSGSYKPVNGGVVLAAILFVGVAGGLMMIRMNMKKGSSQAPAVPAVQIRDGDAAYSLLTEVPLASDVPVPPLPPTITALEPGQPRIVVNGVEQSASTPVLKGVRLFIVNDVKPMPQSISDAIERLNAQHAVLVGGVPPQSVTPAEGIELQAQQEAEIRVIRGIRDLEDPAVARDLTAWAARNEVDGIVWLAPVESDEPSADRFRMLVVMSAQMNLTPDSREYSAKITAAISRAFYGAAR